MPNEIQAQIQVEYVCEVATVVETQIEAHTAPEMTFPLVDRESFLKLLRERKGCNLSLEDEQFWDVLFGNYPAKPVSPGMENPYVHYLTMDSCEKILKHRVQFKSGIDFQHLPAGFFLTKNPLNGGVCDVLHYSDYYKEFQPEDDNNVFAITLMTEDELKKAPSESSPFTGFQKEWYEFLKAKRTSGQDVYCTESQLKDAFIQFSNIIGDKGLEFFEPNFSEDLRLQSGNPLVLLGRWETILSNPRLKRCDLKDQWNAIPWLSLLKSHEAIRAITDYAQDSRPCGFLLPNMRLDEKGFVTSFVDPFPDQTLDELPNAHLVDFWGVPSLVIHDYGFRSKEKLHGIGAFQDEFSQTWRNIAYQPKRNSIAFYENALKLIPGNAETMWPLLAASTTGDNHHAENSHQEAIELEAWKAIGQAVEFGPPGLRGLTHISTFLTHLIQLPTIPNIFFLESIAQHMKDHLLRPNYLNVLTTRLSLLVSILRSSFYQGAKFYFIDRQWKKLNIHEYINLQYEFYKLVGGEHTINNSKDRFDDTEKNLSHKFIIFAPHLSTFNLSSIKEIQEALSTWPEIISQEQEIRLTFCFNFFNDIQKNTNLSPQTLANLISHVITFQTAKDEKWQLALLAHLKKHFKNNFEKDYFSKQEKQIRDACFGLTAEQIAKIRACSLPDHATQALISLESTIVQQNIPNIDEQFAHIHDQLMNLKHIITAEDFMTFTLQLDEIRDLVASDFKQLSDLIEQIIVKRTLEGFSQIFVRNEIEKSKEHLIQKFTTYIKHIKPLGQTEHLKLDRLTLQETLATIVLNSTKTNLDQIDEFQQKITELISQLNHGALTHPHIKHYILSAINHMLDKNTPHYLEHVMTFGKTIQEMSDILTAGRSALAKEYMFVIYSLLAHFHKKPTELNDIFKKVQELPDRYRAFILTFVSRLMDSHQSIDGIDKLIDLLNKTPEKIKLFTKICRTPPYPDIHRIQSWLEAGTFEEEYKAFSLKPFGERRLDYAFQYEQYNRQRKQFVGLHELFTPAIGSRLEEQLTINRDKPITTLKRELKELRNQLPLSDENKLCMMCLCVELMARTASQLSHDTQPKIVSQELNTTQLMALYAKLIHPSNRLISQIDTGEGKSRIMMILAATQALQGKTVDFLTSDLPLAERDYLAYKQFYTILEIPSSLITLNTPSQLYQKGGVNFSDNSQLLLLRNRSDIEQRPFDYLDEQKDKRCLLVDEVDKFIHDKSRDAYNFAEQSRELAGFVWIYPNLVKFMQTLALSPNLPFNPEQHAEDFIIYVKQNVLNREHKASLAGLYKRNPTLVHTWLRSAHTALKMEKDKHYLISSSEREKLFLMRDEEGHARYSQKIFVLDNGRPVEGSTFSEGVHQCLCAKENILHRRQHGGKHDAFVILPENVTMRASFPVTFMAKYDEGSIYGVSGTTRSAAPLSNLDEINHEKYSYLIVPREKPLIREEKNVWLAKDEKQQIQFIKRAILKKLKENAPVLLICKDDQQSERFHEALKNDADFMQKANELHFQHVHGLTSKEDELKAIQHAGLPGFLTLSTAGMFGRGVDINSDNLLVLAAYVPTEEDEIQIKGRTARIGKPGEYRMIPNMQDADYPLNGRTFNVHNQVVKSQKKRQAQAAFQKEVSSLYAFFLEDITKQFLDDLVRCSNDKRVERLKEWQRFLSDMQKDWDPHRQQLLKTIENENLTEFSDTFCAFSEKWISAVPVALINQDKEKQSKDIHKTYTAIMAQQRFFTPARQPIKEQREYDVSDDGQARVYSTLFAQTRATFRGEREFFANFRAWWEGRGVLFADLRAVLKGERKLFANLRATITRWIAEWTEWQNAKKVAHANKKAVKIQSSAEKALDMRAEVLTA